MRTRTSLFLASVALLLGAAPAMAQAPDGHNACFSYDLKTPIQYIQGDGSLHLGAAANALQQPRHHGDRIKLKLTVQQLKGTNWVPLQTGVAPRGYQVFPSASAVERNWGLAAVVPQSQSEYRLRVIADFSGVCSGRSFSRVLTANAFMPAAL